MLRDSSGVSCIYILTATVRLTPSLQRRPLFLLVCGSSDSHLNYRLVILVWYHLQCIAVLSTLSVHVVASKMPSGARQYYEVLQCRDVSHISHPLEARHLSDK